MRKDSLKTGKKKRAPSISRKQSAALRQEETEDDRLYRGNTYGPRRYAGEGDGRMSVFSPHATNRKDKPERFFSAHNEFGTMEAGLDRERRVTLAVGRHKRGDFGGLAAHQKTLSAKRAKSLRGSAGARGTVLADPTDAQESALAFAGPKRNASRGARDGADTLIRTLERGESETLSDVAPYLSTREDEDELGSVKDELEECGPDDDDGETRTALSRRADFLRRVIAQKQQRRREMTQKLSLQLMRKRRKGLSGGHGGPAPIFALPDDTEPNKPDDTAVSLERTEEE